MAGGRNVQVIAIARSMLLDGRSRFSASRPSLRRKIVSKTHSVVYQNNAQQLIFCSISILAPSVSWRRGCRRGTKTFCTCVRDRPKREAFPACLFDIAFLYVPYHMRERASLYAGRLISASVLADKAVDRRRSP